MSAIRRRAPANGDEALPPRQRVPTADTPTLRTYYFAAFLMLLSLVFVNRKKRSFPNWNPPNSQKTPTLDFSTSPDDEYIISNYRLVVEDYVPPNFHESAVVCMPTVARTNVEYVSNAVKSFRLATRNSTSIRRILVYIMDDPPTEPAWISKVFADEGIGSVANEVPSWLEILSREGVVKEPREATLGDSWERVVWRSKEALDYAQVLERCAAATDAKWVIVVQDDVLFRSSIADAVSWTEENVIDETREVNGRRVARVCSGSLFDIESADSKNGDELKNSNMVARVWRRDDVNGWVKYFNDMFDDAPIDWLADRRCQRRRGWVPVMWPNPVRHRGKVSSFAKNQREGLLT